MLAVQRMPRCRFLLSVPPAVLCSVLTIAATFIQRAASRPKKSA